MRIDLEQAEAVALKALAFLAADEDRFGRFLALTGVGPAELRQLAAEPVFLSGVLDHMLADEPLLLAFAAEQSFDPAFIKAARRRLPAPLDE